MSNPAAAPIIPSATKQEHFYYKLVYKAFELVNEQLLRHLLNEYSIKSGNGSILDQSNKEGGQVSANSEARHVKNNSNGGVVK